MRRAPPFVILMVLLAPWLLAAEAGGPLIDPGDFGPFVPQDPGFDPPPVLDPELQFPPVAEPTTEPPSSPETDAPPTTPPSGSGDPAATTTPPDDSDPEATETAGDGPTDAGGASFTGLGLNAFEVIDDMVSAPPDGIIRVFYADNDRYPADVEVTVAQPEAGVVQAVGGDDPHFVYTADDDLVIGDSVSFTYTVCASLNQIQAAQDLQFEQSAPTPALSADGAVPEGDDDEITCHSGDVTIEIVAEVDDADGEELDPERDDAGTVAEPGGPRVSAPSTCQEPLEWGGHQNGRIPAGEMMEIGDGHRLATEAAEAYIAMRAAAAEDGVDIRLTDSYRSFEAQVRVRQQKGHLVATATPGTSKHGWGKALDINVRDPGVREWLEANSRDYAWINPPWAQRPGKSFEPWHYEYYGTGALDGNSQCDGIGVALTSTQDEASEGSAIDAAPITADLPIPLGRVGLGTGSLVSLGLAALLVSRDVRRGAQARDRGRSG